MVEDKKTREDLEAGVKELLLMHDETDATLHRELSRKGKDISWDLIDTLKMVHDERKMRQDTNHHLGKGVLLWLTISVLTLLAGALLLAVRQAVLQL